MAWPLSLFLSLTILCHDADFFVNAFATRIRTRSPFSCTHGRAMMWSSSKASAVEDKLRSTVTPIDKESSSRETKISEESLEPIGDMNEDASVKSMINEATVADDESEKDNLMNQIKESGVAGVISYASWELAFWTVSVPVCVFGYKEVTGHWPDLKNKDDISKLGAEAFAFVNFARFAVPLRIGLALGTTPWIQENIVDVFLIDKDSKGNKDEDMVVKVSEDSDHPDNTDIFQSTKESEDVDDSNNATKNNNDEENINCKGSRFRIRSRIGNLIKRVFRLRNQ